MKIYRFRNVVPGTELEFHPQLNVLLGRNGTGKTTLLRWLADILSGATKNWAHEPYDVELEIQGNEAHTTVRVKNEAVDLREQFPERLRHREPLAAEWAREHRGRAGAEFIIDIEIPNNNFTLHATPSKITTSLSGTHLHDWHDWYPRGGFIDLLVIVLYMPIERDAPHEKKFEHIRPVLLNTVDEIAESYRNLCRFDESLDFFHRLVLGDEKIATIRLWSNNRNHANVSGVMPRELEEQLERQAPELMRSKPSAITFRDTDLSFLEKAKYLFGYSAASMALSILSKNVHEAQRLVSYQLGEFSFTFERCDGSSFRHDHLSYGQKRALSFLYYLASNPALIVVDELVNGLHHAWIEACRDEIGDRQAVLTSQNPLLLDHIPFESPEDVRQRFILCSSRRKGTKEELVWRNPSKEEAESFFSAYAAGIQHVGEILMDKGLW